MNERKELLCPLCSGTVNGAFLPVYHPAARPHGSTSQQCVFCGGTLCPVCTDDHNWPTGDVPRTPRDDR